MTDSENLATASPAEDAASSGFVGASRSAPAPMPAASGSPTSSSGPSEASQTSTSVCTHGPVPAMCAFVAAAESSAAAAAVAAPASPSAGGAAAAQGGHHARLDGMGSRPSTTTSPSISATTVPSSVASALYSPMASGAGSTGSGRGPATGAVDGAPTSAHTSAAASPSVAVAAAGAAFFEGGSPQWMDLQQRLLPPGDYSVSAEAPVLGSAAARHGAGQSGGGSLSHSLSLRAGTSAGGTHASAAATASAGMTSSPRPTALPDIGFPENADDCAWLLAPAASATVHESDGGSAPTPTASAAAAARSARSSPFAGNAAGGGVAGVGGASSGDSPAGAGAGGVKALGGSGSGASSRRSSSGSCGGGRAGGGCSDPTWAFMEEPGRSPAGAAGAGVFDGSAAFGTSRAAAVPPMSPGLSDISSTAYGAPAGGNRGAGYWHSGISTASASPFGTPAKPAGASGPAAGAGASASPAPAPFVNPLFVTPSKDARASGRSIERSDSGGDIALPLLPYGGVAAVAAAAAAGYATGGGRHGGTGSGDGDGDGSLSYTSSAGPSTYAGSVGAAGPVPWAAGGSGTSASVGAPFGTPQGPAGAQLYPQLQQHQHQQQLNPAHAAWTGVPPQWQAPGLPHASPLMVLNPMYAQEQAAAASSSSAAQSTAVSPGVDAVSDPAFATATHSQPAPPARQPPLGWGSPAFRTAGSGSTGGGSQSTPLGWGSPTFPAPASPARGLQQQYPQHPQPSQQQQQQQQPAAAWSTPQVAAQQQAPMLFSGADSAAAAGAAAHVDGQAVVTPRQGGVNGGEGLLSTPKQQPLAQAWGSQLTSPMSSVQGSPNSQQAKHAAALLRNANDAVDEARTLVSRGDEAWLQHVAETLAAVQNAIDALKWQ